MRILTDENVDRPIATWLAERGHDVIEASVIASEATDEDLIAMSRVQDRILMTFDRDIGRLVQSDSLPHPGVVYLRLRGAGPQLLDTFKRIWPSIEPHVVGHFVTVKNDQVRRRPLPIEPS